MVAPGNVDRIRRLADAVERSETYDQGTWWVGGPDADSVTPLTVDEECGSPGCLAGHARVLWGVQGEGDFWLDQIGHALDTRDDVAGELFSAAWDVDDMSEALGVDVRHLLSPAQDGTARPTRHQAAAVLRAWADAIEAEVG